MSDNYNPFVLKGRTILVTGASSGIGRMTTICCSKMGARLIVTGRNQERLDEVSCMLESDDHQVVAADLTQPDQVDHLLERLPVVDGVVLCAGQGTVVPFKMADRKKQDPIFEINYFAPVELLRLLLKKKKLANGASVVFVSSIGGVDSITIGNSIYGASKAALNSAMRFCALELAPKKIRVNSVCPGMVNTRLIQGGAISEEQHQADMQKYPLKRYGEPEDIAYGIVYLLSDASSWVTGHSLVIDGGYTL
jgi:NAD(P)-dependent dehydrogenase (short-subunit alcohol dehydrogenase family)